MALESTATYTDSLNIAWPDGADQRSTADDHIRLVKGAIKRTLPNVTGAITRTHTELNNIGSLSYSLLNSVGIDTTRLGYRSTDAEIAASVTPVDYAIPSHEANGGYAIIDRYQTNTTSGTTDMRTGFLAAVAVAQAAKCNVGGYPTVYAIGSKASITVSGNGITISGVPGGGMQQGSSERNLTFAYIGAGATAMFEVTGTYVQWRDVSFQNRGSATYAVVMIPGGRNSFYRCTASIYNATLTRFATAVFRYQGGSNYDFIEDCEFLSGAPVLVDYDGLSGGSTGTSLYFKGGVYEAVSGYHMTVLACTNGAPESCSMNNITFNSQSTGKLTIVDCTSIGASYSIDSLRIRDCEMDATGQVSTWNSFKLKNVENCDFKNNVVTGSGVQTTVFDLVNSTLFFGKNTFRSIGSSSTALIAADSDSRVFYRPNYIPGNILVVANSTTTTGIVNVTYANPSNIFGYLGDPGAPTTYNIDVTNNSNFNINAPLPGETPGGYFVRGQHVIVCVRNKSGGAMGTATFNTSYFKTSSAFTSPADTYSRSVMFVFSGTHLVELIRGAADVPND